MSRGWYGWRHMAAQSAAHESPPMGRARAVKESLRVNIFFLVDLIDETCGGAERFAAVLAIELAQRGFGVTLCATRHLSEVNRLTLRAAGVATVTLNRRAKWDIHRLLRLPIALRRSDAHILHTHKFGSNAWGTLFGRIARVPVVIAHEHTWAYQGSALRRIIDGQLIGRFADLFVAVSDHDAQRMISYEKVPPEKVAVFPTASVSATVSPKPWNVRAAIGLAQDAKIVSVAAMMRPQKALHVLIEAMAAIVAFRSDVHLVIVGDGECRAALQKLTTELGLTGHVHFMGTRDNVLGLLVESDCAALSSDYEGMPLFILESLAAGTPIVATDVGAVRDMVRDGETGYLVPPRSPDRLAEGILRVLNDFDARNSMSVKCKALAKKYTIESVTNQFSELYTTLARQRGLVN